MRASDLAEPQPTVLRTTTLSEAVRLTVEQGRPGVVVTTQDGRPVDVLPATLLLRLALPAWARDDPGLAAALTPEAADQVCRASGGRTLGELRSPHHLDDLPLVPAGATSLEVAAVLSRSRSPIVGVVDDGRVIGVLTATRLLAHLLHDPAA